MRFRIFAASLLGIGILALSLIGCRQGADRRSPPEAGKPSGTAPGAADPADPGGAALSAPQEKLAALGFQLPREPTRAVDFELEDLQGERVSLKSFQGRIVLLNFWATWCPPCRAEMPSLERLHQAFRGRDFALLAVDLQEEKDQVQRFAAEYSLSFRVLLDSSGQVGSTYGVRSIPTTYLIDRRGFLLARFIGGREWDAAELRSLLEELLGP